MPQDREDLHIIDRILAGEQALYAGLVNSYKHYVLTITSKILNSRQDAEEAAQDAFVKAYHHLKDFNRQAKFSTWLYRIAFNTAISYKRKEKFFHSIENTPVPYDQDSHRMMEKDDRKKYINRAIQKLKDNDRLVITLFYLKEFSLEEIAGITGIPQNTVKIRVHRARLKLATELKRMLEKEALTL